MTEKKVEVVYERCKKTGVDIPFIETKVSEFGWHIEQQWGAAAMIRYYCLAYELKLKVPGDLNSGFVPQDEPNR